MTNTHNFMVFAFIFTLCTFFPISLAADSTCTCSCEKNEAVVAGMATPDSTKKSPLIRNIGALVGMGALALFFYKYNSSKSFWADKVR